MNKQDQPLIFELSKEGRIGYSLPDLDVPEQEIPSLFDETYIVMRKLSFLKYLSLILCVIIQHYQDAIMGSIPDFILLAHAR